MTRLKILAIGALPPPLGGVSVSFKVLLDRIMERPDITVDVVDFSALRRKYGESVLGFVALCKAVATKAMKCQVVTVYFATTALPSFGVVLLLVCALMRKPLIIRKAANSDYMTLGFIQGQLANLVVRGCTIYLAETHHLVQLARDRGIQHANWYPTNRPMPPITAEAPIAKARRFAYVGQVRRYKGIQEIAAACRQIDDTVQVHVYGPWFEDLDTALFDECPCIEYLGVLPPDSVISTLQSYHVLLLPTKATSEGYPGVVFEAYAAGIPIITTRCGAIPEIVDCTTGLFVRPGDADSLRNAMLAIMNDSELYLNLVAGVRKKRSQFDSALWADRFIDYCAQATTPELKQENKSR